MSLREINNAKLFLKISMLEENYPDETSQISSSEILSEVKKVLSKNHVPILDKIPLFPYEVFPASIQDLICEANACLNFPIDFLGLSILFTVSIAIGNSYRVEVKKEWYEIPVFFFANVGKPNTNKSHPLSFALRPIFERDREFFRKYEMQLNEYNKYMALTKKERKEQNADSISKPTVQKIIVSDFTPEALAEVHKFNPRGLGVYVDELSVWFKNFNRYHKGSAQEFWLSSWSGKPIYIDRKNGSPIYISSPFISVVGNIPTRTLHELASENRAQNGFIDRILFAFPQGVQKPYWSEREINPIKVSAWNKVVSVLLEESPHFDVETGILIPKILKLSSDGQVEFMKWFNANTDLCNLIEDEMLSSILGKFDIHALRLSLLLQMLKFACGEAGKDQIEVDSLAGALKLVEYFQATSNQVFNIISNRNPLDKLTASKKKFYEELPDIFSTSEGLIIAEKNKINERTVKRFFNQKEFFRRINRGEYEKLIY